MQNIKFQPNIQTINLMGGCTAAYALPVEWVDLVNPDYQEMQADEQVILDAKTWGVELGIKKEFHRKELYEEIIPHRFKYSSLRP